NPVSKLLEEKEEALLSEKSKYKALEQEHSKTVKLAKREIVMAMHEEYETNKTILEQSRANKQGIKGPKNEGIEAPLHKSEAAIAGYEKALGLKSNAEDILCDLRKPILHLCWASLACNYLIAWR
ncbi:unnamed protein product, partial [Cylindrotheca closterium]